MQYLTQTASLFASVSLPYNKSLYEVLVLSVAEYRNSLFVF